MLAIKRAIKTKLSDFHSYLVYVLSLLRFAGPCNPAFFLSRLTKELIEALKSLVNFHDLLDAVDFSDTLEYAWMECC
jgi:hypothetical protein